MNCLLSWLEKNNNGFFVTIMLCITGLNIDYGIENIFSFSRLKILQYLSIFVLSIIFWLVFISSKLKKYNAYQSDKFYVVLMFGVTLFGFVFTLKFINWNMREYDNSVHNAVRLWEVLSFIVTFIYTGWFWFISKNGKTIRNIIDYSEMMKKLEDIDSGSHSLERFPIRFEHFIWMTILFLFLLTIGHFLLLFEIDFFEEYTKFSMVITVFLIGLTYFNFNRIGRKVISSTDKEIVSKENDSEARKIYKKCLEKARKEYNEEFKLGLKYVDKPMFLSFVIMFLYVSYCTIMLVYFDADIKQGIELFIGGATAFELLLSSIMWAKTDTW